MDEMEISSLIARLQTALKLAPTSSSPPLALDGVLQDLRDVRRKWRMIEAALADAEEREAREPAVRSWVRELRDLSRMAEDLHDLYGYQLVANRVAQKQITAAGGIAQVHDLPLEETSFWQEVADRAMRIKEEFAKIAMKKEALNLKEGSSRNVIPITNRPHNTGLSFSESELVGRDEELEELFKLSLTNGDENIEVIAVVAMGGVGKTSLAQHVFNDLKERGGFDAMGWVFVSEDFNQIRLMAAALHEFGGGGYNDHTELSIIQEAVCDAVEGKRFFLVLDDVWNKNIAKWDTFLAPFKYGAKEGSKILITTREQEVVGTVGAVHCMKLESLTEDDGWSLLRQHAFRNPSDDYPKELVDIGKGIVEKCRGLPLAIKVLGRLLYGKDDEDEWNLVLESKLWDFLENERSGKQILGPLYFSYLQLPPHLKVCFKFCSFFGRGRVVLRKELVDLWIVHNLIKDNPRASLEDTANSYVDNLESRSFLETRSVMPVCNEFTIHHLMYDIAVYVSEGEFLTVDAVPTERLCPQPTARHIRIFPLSVVNLKEVAIETCNIRTLHIHRAQDSSFSVCVSDPSSLHVLHIDGAEVVNFDACLGQAKLLRTLTYKSEEVNIVPESLFRLYNLRKLDITFLQINQLPDSIGNLENLRYLSLAFTKIRRIPEAVCSLQNLRTLKLCGLDIKVLPESLHKLTNLQELNLLRCEKLVELPESLNQLVNLRELNVDFCLGLRELPRGLTNLTKLQSLRARYSSISYLPAGLSGLKRLQDLPYFPVGQNDDMHARINDLKNLVNVKTELQICNIINIRSEEIIGLEIVHKPALIYLGLHWENNKSLEPSMLSKSKIRRNETDEEVKEAELVLEQLRPHTDVEILDISGYMGRMFPVWIGDPSFINLNYITLKCCRNCLSISPLERLPFLDTLTIIGMPSLVKLVPDDVLDCEEGLFFPSLQTLDIRFCHGIAFLPIYRFVILSSLHVEGCSHLKEIGFSRPDQTEASEGVTLSLIVVDCHRLSFSSSIFIPQSLENLFILRCKRLASWCEVYRESKLAHVPSVEVSHSALMYFPAVGLNYSNFIPQQRKKRKNNLFKWIAGSIVGLSLKKLRFQPYLAQKRKRRKITGGA